MPWTVYCLTVWVQCEDEATRWGFADLTQPIWFLLHRFQVPVDEHTEEHGQNMYDETPGR